MGAKERQSNTDSSKAEVGEIDTSAPFQSVKDAVTLFGEGAFSGEKPAIRKPTANSAETVLAKETQLHLAQKELHKLKDQIETAEKSKAEALSELENAKRTVDDLTQQLKTVTESKDAAFKVMETAKNQAKVIGETKSVNPPGSDTDKQQDLESAREKYMMVFSELDSAKQELRRIHQECDASLEAKLAALNQATQAEEAVKTNMKRVSELSKEISSLQDSIGEVKIESLRAQQEQAQIFSDKDVQKQSCKATLEASANKLLALKNEFDLENSQNLEKQLQQTMNEIGAIRKQTESAKASDLESLRSVTSELDGAKESLQKVVEEEKSLRSVVESLKLELENVKKEQLELKEKEAETESVAGSLHVKLRKVKYELETAVAEELKARDDSEEMISTLHQLSLEAETARLEAEDMESGAEELKTEAEAARIELEEAENKLKAALQESEEAKAAEAQTLDQIKKLSERTSVAHASTLESDGKITISRDEFESFSHIGEKSDSLAEMKVAAAMAQAEAVKASGKEALKKLEAMQKESEDMNAATEDALKKAEMAEAAKRAVETELGRWREREQKKAAETASRILAETKLSYEASPQYNYRQKLTEQKVS